MLPSKLLDWFRHTIVDFSERKVEEAIDEHAHDDVDFEAMSDQTNPMCADMRRRYHIQQARQDQSDLE
jgi:hypothetical protein